MQIQTLITVRPLHFGYNTETAVSNTFQKNIHAEEAAQKARTEFDGAVATLRAAGIPVRVFEDLPGTPLPDSVFPNNWFSTHEGGRIHVYPMLTPSRRAEVRADVLGSLKNEFGYLNITDYRLETGICEGTGSLVFDHGNRLGYAVVSPRTEKPLAEKIIRDLNYTPVFLQAFANGTPIYHTNVLMCVAPEFTVICLQALDAESRNTFLRHHPAQKEIMEITPEQMDMFAGNMLAVDTANGKFLVLSQTAKHALYQEQIRKMEQHRKIVTLQIPTIETLGGGSARCMLAEIY